MSNYSIILKELKGILDLKTEYSKVMDLLDRFQKVYEPLKEENVKLNKQLNYYSTEMKKAERGPIRIYNQLVHKHNDTVALINKDKFKMEQVKSEIDVHNQTKLYLEIQLGKVTIHKQNQWFSKPYFNIIIYDS